MHGLCTAALVACGHVGDVIQYVSLCPVRRRTPRLLAWGFRVTSRPGHGPAQTLTVARRGYQGELPIHFGDAARTWLRKPPVMHLITLDVAQRLGYQARVQVAGRA